METSPSQTGSQKTKVENERFFSPKVPGLAAEIAAITGENVNLCFQCQKCASGCPLLFAMDYTPSQIIHSIRLGLDDIVMESKTMWLCASCQTCTTRCPQGLDIAKVMDGAKILAQKKGIKSSEPEIHAFYRAMMDSILGYGRVYELGMIMSHKFRTGKFFKDMGLGMKMFSKGKLKLIPTWAGGGKIRKINRALKEIEGGEK
ncbi:MAG: 4Fe-4S dicluster domain-containing protein [Myxococcota bacterium]